MNDLKHYNQNYELKLLNANNEIKEADTFCSIYHKKTINYFEYLVETATEEDTIIIIEIHNKVSPVTHTEILKISKQNNEFNIEAMFDFIPNEYRDILTLVISFT